MLTRIANSLYWMGRYIERTEHLSRYLKVQYFTMQDAPMSQNNTFVLRSIANMAGLEEDPAKVLSEEEILLKIALDPGSSFSIRSATTYARENARGMRNVISTELWEAVNKYYHFVNNYPAQYYQTQGLYDFTVTAIEHCAVLRANIDSTLVHDDVWAMIRLGIHMERTIQIARILSCKLVDISILTEGMENPVIENYQYTTTLKVLAAFDMSHRYYKKAPDRASTCEFLIINDQFPRSIAFNLKQIKYFLEKISANRSIDSSPVLVKTGKLAGYYKYLLYEEIAGDLPGFLLQTQSNIHELHTLIEQKYLHY